MQLIHIWFLLQVDPSEVMEIQFAQPVHTDVGENSSKDVTNGNALPSKKSSEFGLVLVKTLL